jgi:hypothetical protein
VLVLARVESTPRHQKCIRGGPHPPTLIHFLRLYSKALRHSEGYIKPASLPNNNSFLLWRAPQGTRNVSGGAPTPPP